MKNPSISRARFNGINKAVPWVPMPGPQLEAMLSPADVLLFGGSAGSSKTDLLIGLALNVHKKTLFVRREATQLMPVIDRIAEILGHRDGLNITTKQWHLGGGRVISFAGVPNAGDEMKYQGQARDLVALDEAANLLQSQVEFLMGWTRSTDPKQRCRVVMASNPPTAAEGRWIVDYFKAWLDPTHKNPAKPGEVRWYCSIDGESTEVESGAMFQHKGEWIKPLSRSFIPGRLTDNRFLRDTAYLATLQALPKVLRQQMLHGDFMAGTQDGDYQLIPTADIKEAMNRWEPRDVKGPITCIGVDPARGGADSTVIAVRHGWWFDELDIHPDTPSGGSVAALIIKKLNGDFSIPVFVDVIGIGSSVYDCLTSFGVNAIAINAASRSEETDITGNIEFSNTRVEMYYKLKDLLGNGTSASIELPPDQQLLAELTAPQYKLASGGKMALESKQDIVRRLGNSPDRADAVCLASIKAFTSATVTPIKVVGGIKQYNQLR